MTTSTVTKANTRAPSLSIIDHCEPPVWPAGVILMSTDRFASYFEHCVAADHDELNGGVFRCGSLRLMFLHHRDDGPVTAAQLSGDHDFAVWTGHEVAYQT